MDRERDAQGELAEAAQVDRADGARDLHQTRVLARIVARKYWRTKFGMWLLAIAFGAGALAALLSARL
jgi:hypothetical protein